jgi:hypothetical protein
MATTQSKSFQAPPEQVWAAVIKLVTSAGYSVTETNAAARQIVYRASGGGWAWAQSVKVSVAGVAENETLVTVHAEAAEQVTLTEGGQQRKLIAFVFDALQRQFPLAAGQQNIADAPGTSGCFGGVLLLVAGMSAAAFAFLSR